MQRKNSVLQYFGVQPRDQSTEPLYTNFKGKSSGTRSEGDDG